MAMVMATMRLRTGRIGAVSRVDVEEAITTIGVVIVGRIVGSAVVDIKFTEDRQNASMYTIFMGCWWLGSIILPKDS